MHKLIQRLLGNRSSKQLEEEFLVKRRRNMNIDEIRDNRELISEKDFDNITNLVFSNIVYYKCSFNEVTFRGVKFKNCEFIECNFSQTYFISCDAEPFTCNYFLCSFMFSYIGNSELPGTNFFDTLFFRVEIESVNMKQSRFEMNAFYETKFINNCKLYGARFKFINWADIQFLNDNAYTKLDSKTYIAKFGFNDDLYYNVFEDRNIEYRNLTLGKTIRNFNKQYRLNDEHRQEQELLYLAHCYENLNSSGVKRLLNFIAKISCGYGEKWTYSITFSLALILIFSIIYMFLGIEVTNLNLLMNNFKDIKQNNIYIIDYNMSTLSCLSIKSFIIDLIISIYYSMMTFTTVGYGNINTISLSGMIFSTIEMFLGALLMAIMVGTVLRNATR